jgi:hypothetical protein
MTGERTDAPGAVTIWPDWVDYLADYVASLAASPTAPVPVFSPHPDVIEAILREQGFPIAPPVQPADEFRAFGKELAAVEDNVDQLALIEPRLRQITGREGRDGGEVVVGVGRTAVLGLLRAAADRRPFTAVSDLAEVRPRDARTMYLVTEELGPTDPVALQRRVDDEARWEVLPGLTACPLGFLTGRDVAMMTWLDAKQRRARRSDIEAAALWADLVIDSTHASAPDAQGGPVVPYRATSRDTVTARSDIGLLAITSHGMSDLVHLNDDYLCGRSRYLTTTAPTGPIPSCQMAEGGCCYFKPDGRPLAGHQLPAAHLFVNSCGSLRFKDGEFDPHFAVWYAAIEGRARSFVGSVRWKDGHGLEGLLYRRLLRQGVALGTAVTLVNRALPGSQIEGEGVYVLLGDPAERLTTTGVRWATPVTLTAGSSRLQLRDGWAHALVESPPLLQAFTEGGLLVASRDRSGPHHVAVPTDDRSALHLFLFESHDRDSELSIDIADLSPELARVRGLAETIEATLDPKLGMPGLYPDQVRQGRRKNLEARLLQIARLAKRRFTEPAAVNKLHSACRRLFQEADQLDAEIAGWLHERIRTTSYRFSEHYQESFFLAENGVRSTCPLCHGQLSERRLRHVLRPAVRRTELLCRRCGGITDTPDPGFLVLARMEKRQLPGGSAEVTVELVNHTDRRWAGHCTAAVRRSGTYRITQPDPVRRVTAEPHQVTSVPFSFTWDPAMPVHQYDVQAAFVSETQLWLGRCEFWIQDENRHDR